MNKKKTTHSILFLRRRKNFKKCQCNAGQPQVPGRGLKGFQSRNSDDEAVGAGPLINFLFAGFKLKAPSLAQQLFLSVFLKNEKEKKKNSLQTCFLFFRCRE